MFINMDDMLDMHEVIFEIYVEDKLFRRQQMKAPKEMLIMSFLKTAEQASNDTRPIKIKMTRPQVIWDMFENKEKTINNEIEFMNNAMIAWDKDNKE